MICGKWEKELEGITVGLNGIVTHSHDVKEVLVEEPMYARGKFHMCFQSRVHAMEEELNIPNVDLMDSLVYDEQSVQIRHLMNVEPIVC